MPFGLREATASVVELIESNKRYGPSCQHHLSANRQDSTQHRKLWDLVYDDDQPVSIDLRANILLVAPKPFQNENTLSGPARILGRTSKKSFSSEIRPECQPHLLQESVSYVDVPSYPSAKVSMNTISNPPPFSSVALRSSSSLSSLHQSCHLPSRILTPDFWSNPLFLMCSRT